MQFSEWLTERMIPHGHITHPLGAALRQLLDTPEETGGYVVGQAIHVLSHGKSGGVFLGHAGAIRSLHCDYTFHTHPRDTDVPYPSAVDVVATYMTGKPDLVICQNGIWMVSPLQQMDWRKVEQISNQFKQEAKDYWDWREKVADFFKVKIEKVYEF